MSGSAHFAAFLLASALVIVVPGPAVLYVVGRVQASLRAATAAVGGIVVGDVILIGLSGLGVAALLQRWPVLAFALRAGGAAYVAWLGIGLLRSKRRLAETNVPRNTAVGDFLRGALITLSNPKPILFFAAFFPLFLDGRAGGTLPNFYLLGLWFEAMNMVWFAGLILAVRRLQRNATLASLPVGIVNRLAGCGLLLCAGLALLGDMH